MTRNLLGRFASVFLTLALLGASAPPAMAQEGAGGRTLEGAPDAPSRLAGPVATGPILVGALEAAAREAAMQRGGRTRRSNPYGTASYVLMGAGGVMTLYGMLYRGAKCEYDPTTFIDCKRTANKGLLFSGLGAAGLGVWLFVKGEGQRNTVPSVWFDGRHLAVSKQWSF